MYSSCVGNSCRYKVKWQKKRFEDPKAAEKIMFPRVSTGVKTEVLQHSVGSQTDPQPPCVQSHVSTQTLTYTCPQTEHHQRGHEGSVRDISLLSEEFSSQCKNTFQLDVPPNFLKYAATAMVQLKKSKRSNVVYNLAKRIGTQRADSSDS